MKVYTVEIYDTTEYNNSILDLQVFECKKDAEQYIKEEIKKYLSYQDIYTLVDLTEWYGKKDQCKIIFSKTGKEIFDNLNRVK